MDSARVRIVQKQNTPKTFPCPQCCTPGRRKDTHTRQIRDIAYGEIVFIELTVGEYRASCACCKTFRSHVEGIEPRAEYTNRVREAVIDRILDDGMNLERIQKALKRDFLLDLSDGFLYDCLDWKVRQIDMPAYRQWTLENFSGTLCVDELHLGHRTLLLATDPLADFPVAFALVSANDQGHMERFLNNLRCHGFLPQVVVTDGSNLYPALLAELAINSASSTSSRISMTVSLTPFDGFDVSSIRNAVPSDAVGDQVRSSNEPEHARGTPRRNNRTLSGSIVT
jgi:hypothetical protein